jgi:hypothetical protein
VACLAWVIAGGCSGDDGPTGSADPDFGNAADGSGDGDRGAAGADGSDGSSGFGPTGSGRIPGVVIPSFPGAGTSDAAKPLENGGLCDYVEGDPIPTAGEVTRCFFGPDDDQTPVATIEQVLECALGVDTLRVRLTFDPSFVDNTYGEGSIGWEDEKEGLREFKKLVGSDHAEILIIDSDGETTAHFALDYVSEDDDAPSGYASLGVEGGDGEMITGDPSIIVDSSTSIDRNLNERGYGDYTVDSPATDESFTPNDDTPEWDYRVVYEAWIDLDAFGDAEFGGAFIEFVHASPSKADDNTIEVVPGECPPGEDPPDDDPCLDGDPDTDCGSSDPPDDPPGEGECPDSDPDADCGSSDPPGTGAPAFCAQFPTDPACRVD